MAYLRIGLMALCLLPGPAIAGTIWKCQELQQVPEFSSIQCAPDAEIYVPSRPNSASGIGTRPEDDRRYQDFISEHNARFEAEQRKRRRSTEGRNLKRFKSYAVPPR